VEPVFVDLGEPDPAASADGLSAALDRTAHAEAVS
jgi:hypothetical protein